MALLKVTVSFQSANGEVSFHNRNIMALLKAEEIGNNLFFLFLVSIIEILWLY